MKPPPQLDLFARKPRSYDEAALIRRLEEAAREARAAAMWGSFLRIGKAAADIAGAANRAQTKRLMRPLPPITVPR